MFCEGCFEKQRIIDRLEDEIRCLKAKLRYEERKIKEGYFLSNTPSSLKIFKENSKSSFAQSKGGAIKGHKGHGRQSISEKDADEIINLKSHSRCPRCKGKLQNKGIEQRSVIDIQPIKIKKILYKSEKKYCPHCKKIIKKKAEIWPNGMYGNQLISYLAVMHYGWGVPLGRVAKILGGEIPKGSIHNIFCRLRKKFNPAIKQLIREYREEGVKHVDETGWRTDGKRGFAWIFCSRNTSIFNFGKNRSSNTAIEILGKKRQKGVLVVDRYRAYNKIRSKIQYCYSHLLRDVKDLGKEFSEDNEVIDFVNTMIMLLAEAIKLQKSNINDEAYYRKANSIKRKILKTIKAPYKHLGIIKIQTIFKKNSRRLYHWVKNRDVPADNNRAERELRPTVIARKVSFGSQSEKGAQTRSIIMSFLHTAQKRLKKNQMIECWLKKILDQVGLHPKINLYSLLPKPNS